MLDLAVSLLVQSDEELAPIAVGRVSVGTATNPRWLKRSRLWNSSLKGPRIPTHHLEQAPMTWHDQHSTQQTCQVAAGQVLPQV